MHDDRQDGAHAETKPDERYAPGSPDRQEIQPLDPEPATPLGTSWLLSWYFLARTWIGAVWNSRWPGTPTSGWRLAPLLRRSFAVGLVGLALWWLVMPMVFPVSSEAVVNAGLVQVRAPME